MNRFSFRSLWAVGFGLWLTSVVAAADVFGSAERASLEGGARVVTYEQFGAVGDGLTDDLPAIVKAHAFANEQRLPVRSNPEATYHLGRRALTAKIQTDTDWSTSRFIIDDSQSVEDNKLSLFVVESRLQPVPLTIERLRVGQTELGVKPENDLFVIVENEHRRVFIRKGRNANRGTVQSEALVVRRDGRIEGEIQWDYDTITRVTATPMDADTLTVRGGVFVCIANRMKQAQGYNYWYRNIKIARSNTVVDGVSYEVVGETDFGHPYQGFLHAERVANITFRNCQISPHKWYETIGAAGEPVPMGTYGYGANFVVNFTMKGCRMGDIHDRSRWGVAGSNFMKNVLIEDCVLSRIDVHQGVAGFYTIRRSTLGHAGIKAIGRGELLVEDSAVYSDNLITFRPDYGATWDGNVTIRNSRWIPPANARRAPVMFSVQNDGTHDFGYVCSMPRTIRIEGLEIDDSRQPADKAGVVFFDSPTGALAGGEVAFPYRATETIEVRGLRTTSGIEPRLSENQQVLAKMPTQVRVTR
jgi:hypothetical protein